VHDPELNCCIAFNKTALLPHFAAKNPEEHGYAAPSDGKISHSVSVPSKVQSQTTPPLSLLGFAWVFACIYWILLVMIMRKTDQSQDVPPEIRLLNPSGLGELLVELLSVVSDSWYHSWSFADFTSCQTAALPGLL